MAYIHENYQTILRHKLQEKKYKVISIEHISSEGDYIAYINTQNLMNDEHILAGKLMLGRNFNEAHATISELSEAVYIERIEIRFEPKTTSYAQYRNLLEATKKIIGSESFNILNIAVDTTGRGEVIFELPSIPAKKDFLKYLEEEAPQAAPEVI